MHRNRNTTIIRLTLGLLLPLAALVPQGQLLAHEGFDHVTGTIAKVAGNVVTVKTTKGNVDVKLDAKTEITKNDQKAAAADLIVGTRIVVDVPEGSKDMVAHSMKLGVASAAKPSSPAAATH
jgi:hypothetical protein